MKPARGLCVACVVEAGIPSLAWPGHLSPCGGYIILDGVSPAVSESVWLEAETAWAWCWKHGAREVPLLTLIRLESSP